MERTIKAGAIVVRRHLKKFEVLLVYRGKHKDWSFPKGHVESGETHEAAMRREVFEETGLSVLIRRKLPRLRYTTPSGENVALEMFLAVPSEPKMKPRPERVGDRVKWVPISDVEGVLTYDNLKSYFRAVKDEIDSSV